MQAKAEEGGGGVKAKWGKRGFSALKKIRNLNMQNNVNCKRGIFCHGLPTAKKKKVVNQVI